MYAYYLNSCNECCFKTKLHDVIYTIKSARLIKEFMSLIFANKRTVEEINDNLFSVFFLPVHVDTRSMSCWLNSIFLLTEYVFNFPGRSVLALKFPGRVIFHLKFPGSGAPSTLRILQPCPRPPFENLVSLKVFGPRVSRD
jgi:hypothetical protein